MARNLLWKCTNCRWHGEEKKLLHADSPFNPQDELVACPQCKSVYDLVNMCDEPNCTDEATCGFPTPTGYRRTCGKHYRVHEVMERGEIERLADIADEIDPHWYHEWCEREGSPEELKKFVEENKACQ
jgi:rubredoxin